MHAEAGSSLQDVFGEEVGHHQGPRATRALSPRGKNNMTVSAQNHCHNHPNYLPPENRSTVATGDLKNATIYSLTRGGNAGRLQAAGEDEKFPNAFNPLSFHVEFLAAETEVNGYNLKQDGLLGSTQNVQEYICAFQIKIHSTLRLPPSCRHKRAESDTRLPRFLQTA